MAKRTTIGQENYHDQAKQVKILEAFHNEIKELDKNQKTLNDELHILFNEEDKILGEEQEHSSQLEELKDSISQQQYQLVEYDKELNELQKNREKLQDQINQQRQTIEDKDQENNTVDKLNEELSEKINDQGFVQEQQELIDDQKEEIKEKLADTQQRIEQIESDIQQNASLIDMVQSDIRFIDQELKYREEDKEINDKNHPVLTEKLEKKQKEIFENEEKTHQLNIKLYQLNYLITRLSQLVETKPNPEQLKQFQTNIKQELDNIQARRKEIQEEIQDINGKIQQLSGKKVNPTTNSSVQQEKPATDSNESFGDSAEVLRIIDLKRQHEDIKDELNFKEEEYRQVEINKNRFEKEHHTLKNEFQPIEQQFRTAEGNLNKFRNQLENDKQFLKTALTNLQVALNSLNEAEQKLRQQQQDIPTVHLQLFESLQKEQVLNQNLQKSELDIQITQQNLEIAEQSLKSAESTLETMKNYIKANPKAEVQGLDSKEEMVSTRQKGVEKLKIDLKKRGELLPKRTSDYQQAKANRIQLETTLKNLQENTLQQKDEVNKQKHELERIQKEVRQQEATVHHTHTQYETAKTFYEESQKEKQEKLKELLSKEREIQIEEQKRRFLERNIQQLQIKGNNYDLLIGDIQKRLNNLKQENSNFVKDPIDDNIQQIGFNQQEIQQNQHEILLLRREDDDLKEKRETFEKLSQLITKDTKQIQLALEEHKRLHDETKQNISKLEQILPSLKIEKEYCEKDVEESKENQRKIHLALQIKVKELMNKKLEPQLYELTRIQYETQSALLKSQYQQYEQQMFFLNELDEKNQQQHRNVELTIKDIEREIDREYRLINETENAIRYARGQVSYIETNISILNDSIREINQEYLNTEPELNASSNKFKTSYEKLTSFARRLADIRPKIFKKESEINGLSHQIALKEDEIRNYIEVQNRYTVDQN